MRRQVLLRKRDSAGSDSVSGILPDIHKKCVLRKPDDFLHGFCQFLDQFCFYFGLKAKDLKDFKPLKK